MKLKRRLNWRALASAIAVALGLSAIGMGLHPLPARAVVQPLATITVTPAPACNPLVTVGIAFDGKELLVSCVSNNTVTRVDPLNGTNLGSYDLTPGMLPTDTGIGAMSWDADVGQLWFATANGSHNVYTALLDQSLHIAVSSFRFKAAGGFTIVDGLAYDGTDKTLWYSPDVSDIIYHYDEAGVLLGSHSGLISSLGGHGNSGIAVASATALYLSNDGGSSIYATDKTFTSFTLFAQTSSRLEDLECDNVDFAPSGALWSKDAFDWILRAFPVPAGQCAQGGQTDQAITAKGADVSATEGAEFTGTVATFTDPDTKSTAAEYSATIDWGDGSPTSTGVVSGAVGGPYTVTGTHTYAEEGTYTITVVITDIDTSGNTAKTTSTASVADAALTSGCVSPLTISPQTYNGPTATFRDANPGQHLEDFPPSAGNITIKWGDGSTSTNGTAAGPNPYTANGSHTYTSTGPFTVTTTITDAGGSTTTVSCNFLIFAFATGSGATFVIGDGVATPLNHVTWWSSQWAALNPMSGGPAPASMKGFAGFEDMPAIPVCGGHYTTDTGNSTPPPQTVPEFMGVIVSSKITQNGSVITGDIVAIVIVHNDPGYAPSPGHPGTGTIVAFVPCV